MNLEKKSKIGEFWGIAGLEFSLKTFLQKANEFIINIVKKRAAWKSKSTSKVATHLEELIKRQGKKIKFLLITLD